MDGPGRRGILFCFLHRGESQRDAMLQRRRGSSCERSSAATLALDPPRRGLPLALRQMPSQSVQGSICSMAQVLPEAKEKEREYLLGACGREEQSKGWADADSRTG